MKPSTFIVTIALWGYVSVAAFADIAPIEYHGAGITPVNAPGIRMLSAKVDITWGVPSALAASFVLDNQTGKPSVVQLGFPVSVRPDYSGNPSPSPAETPASLGFTMTFDGVSADRDKIQRGDAPKGTFPSEVTWYRCGHTFPPGRTTVRVETKLPTTFVYALPYEESLDYLIQTGAAWSGAIGSEEVAIHFPGPIEKGQIIEGKPSGYTIEGDTVRWAFKEFKPAGNDHDIRLQFLRPDVLPTLAQLRAKVAGHPDDAETILSLAKDLFVLGRVKGNAPFPPDWMSQTEYDEASGKLRDPKDRALFRSRYARKDDGLYHEKEEKHDWSPKRMEVLRMFSETDYVRPGAKSVYVDEARERVESLLKTQPHNAQAWIVYLANYYRFHFAGGSYYRAQVEQIKVAHENCPEAPCIRLWYERSKLGPDWVGGSEELKNELNEQLKEKLKEQGVFATTYPKIAGYW